MEKVHKFNSLMKIPILIMLSLYLLIYIGPIGIYDTNQYEGIFEEDDTFEEDRLWAAAMVGISSTLLMIVLHVNEKSEVRKSTMVSLIFSFIHCGLIHFEIDLFKYIPWYTPIDKGKILYNLGSTLLYFIALINCIFLLVSIVKSVVYIINLKKYKSDNRIDKNEIDKTYVVDTKFKNDVEIVTERVVLAFAATVSVISVLSFSISVVCGAILGYVISVICFYNVFLKKWICKGKWIKVILSYIGLAYIVYVLIFYNLLEKACSLWLYIFGV